MVARAMDWYIKEPRDGTRQRRDKVRKAVMMLTDRDFLEWFVAQPRPESPAGQLIRHLVRIEKRGDFQLVRPIRGVFKRFRTYTKNGRGDKASKTIFDLLSQDGSIDVLKYEKNVAKGLSNLIRQQIAAWEIIIDIPRSEEGEMSEVSVWYPKVKQEEYAHKALEEIRHMAKEMKESYVDDSKKIRIYCSPRVRQWLMARETELNSSILQSIKETQAKSVPE